MVEYEVVQSQYAHLFHPQHEQVLHFADNDGRSDQRHGGDDRSGSKGDISADIDNHRGSGTQQLRLDGSVLPIMLSMQTRR
jgi:hypothetical protein